jgi:hypothetical protein
MSASTAPNGGTRHTGGDLLNLLLGVRARVARVGLNALNGQILNYQIVQVVRSSRPLLENKTASN